MEFRGLDVLIRPLSVVILARDVRQSWIVAFPLVHRVDWLLDRCFISRVKMLVWCLVQFGLAYVSRCSFERWKRSSCIVTTLEHRFEFFARPFFLFLININFLSIFKPENRHIVDCFDMCSIGEVSWRRWSLLSSRKLIILSIEIIYDLWSLEQLQVWILKLFLRSFVFLFVWAMQTGVRSIGLSSMLDWTVGRMTLLVVIDNVHIFCINLRSIGRPLHKMHWAVLAKRAFFCSCW